MAGSKHGSAEFLAKRLDRNRRASCLNRAANELRKAQKAFEEASDWLRLANAKVATAIELARLAQEAEAGHQGLDGVHSGQAPEEVAGAGPDLPIR